MPKMTKFARAVDCPTCGATRALEEVVKQLVELYDVDVSVGDPASALRPGEVVSDA